MAHKILLTFPQVNRLILMWSFVQNQMMIALVGITKVIFIIGVIQTGILKKGAILQKSESKLAGRNM
ncbi:MAG TPA: hypothetical protein DEP84_04330 [Chloroflexi bacterium]|nr:hypothetical protein [Chloroflexota bacterium]